jgi:hypothetical protein
LLLNQRRTLKSKIVRGRVRHARSGGKIGEDSEKPFSGLGLTVPHGGDYQSHKNEFIFQPSKWDYQSHICGTDSPTYKTFKNSAVANPT